MSSSVTLGIYPASSPATIYSNFNYSNLKEAIPLLKDVSGILSQPESQISTAGEELRIALRTHISSVHNHVWPLIQKVDLSQPLNQAMGGIVSFLVRWGAFPVFSALGQSAKGWVIRHMPQSVLEKLVQASKNWLRQEVSEERAKKSNEDFSDPMRMTARLLKASNNETEIRAALKDYLPAMEHFIRSSDPGEFLKNLFKEERGLINFIETQFKKMEGELPGEDEKKIANNILPLMSDGRKRQLINAIPSEMIQKISDKLDELLESFDPSQMSFLKKMNDELLKELPESSRGVAKIIFLNFFASLNREEKRTLSVPIFELGKNASQKDQLLRGIQNLGVGAQKFMQQFGDDIQNNDIKDILGTLKQNVQSMSPEERNAIIERNKHGVLSGVEFSDSELKPLKAGTIGEIHLGQYKGQKVVTKIMRQSLLPRVDREFNIYMDIIRSQTQKETAEEEKIKLKSVQGTVENLKNTIQKEVNFEVEKENTLKAKEIYEISDHGYFIKVPEVYGANKEVMIQQRVPGKSVQAYLKEDFKNWNRPEKIKFLREADHLLKLEIQQWMKGVIKHGFIEGDRHDGNTLYDAENKTFYMIDFGASAVLKPEQLKGFRYIGAGLSLIRPKIFRRGLEYFIAEIKTWPKEEKKQLDREIGHYLKIQNLTSGRPGHCFTGKQGQVLAFEVLEKIVDEVLFKRGLAVPEALIQFYRGAKCLGDRVEEINRYKRDLRLSATDLGKLFADASINAALSLVSPGGLKKTVLSVIPDALRKLF